MIKKRGYRIELGEIEAALYRHAAIKEAAVLAFPDDNDVPIKAFVSTRNGSKLSIIELKGLGKDHWTGIDAAAHVARERDSWD